MWKTFGVRKRSAPFTRANGRHQASRHGTAHWNAAETIRPYAHTTCPHKPANQRILAEQRAALQPADKQTDISEGIRNGISANGEWLICLELGCQKVTSSPPSPCSSTLFYLFTFRVIRLNYFIFICGIQANWNAVQNTQQTHATLFQYGNGKKMCVRVCFCKCMRVLCVCVCVIVSG